MAAIAKRALRRIQSGTEMSSKDFKEPMLHRCVGVCILAI